MFVNVKLTSRKFDKIKPLIIVILKMLEMRTTELCIEILSLLLLQFERHIANVRNLIVLYDK